MNKFVSSLKALRPFHKKPEPQTVPVDIEIPEAPVVAVIGNGYSGTQAAIDLIYQSYRKPFTLLMIEKTADLRFGGVAYAAAAAENSMQTNVAASLFELNRSDLDIRDYLKKCAKTRTDLHKRVASGEVTVPRNVLQGYYKAAFELATKREAVNAINIDGEAVRLSENESNVKIQMADGAELKADYVLITTGNQDFRTLPCMEKCEQNPKMSPYYLSSVWNSAQRLKLDTLDKKAPVLIVGTGLSAYDAVCSLLERGHKGPVTMTSRHGFEHRPFPEYYRSGRMNYTYIREPDFIDRLHEIEDPWKLAQMASDEFYELTGYKIDFKTGDMVRHTEAKDHHNIEPWLVLRVWEEYISELADKFGAAQVGEMMIKYRSMINTLRVGASHEVCEQIERAKKKGQLSVLKAHI